jgi:hypothetical protein
VISGEGTRAGETGAYSLSTKRDEDCSRPIGGGRNVDQNNSRAPDADFGRHLASVTERDIDLLLMEEFHVSDDFVAWFCGELGLRGVSSAGAWHSLSDADGESDLLLRVLKEGRRIGILIETRSPHLNRTFKTNVITCAASDSENGTSSTTI